MESSVRTIKDKSMSDQHLLEQIRNGDRGMLRKLYERFRQEFIPWSVRHYDLDEDKAIEVFQQSFTALYYNIREQKITELKSTLKTYLFAIAKNKIRDHFKTIKRSTGTIDEWEDKIAVDSTVMEKYHSNDLKNRMADLLLRIGEPCKSVLEMFYYRHYSMEAIANVMNYSSEQVAAKRKFICLKQMRELLAKL